MSASHQNVDPAEIAKFEDLASRWWDLNSEFKPLHEINPLRANFIDQRSPVGGCKLLDVGCGGGILAEVHGFISDPDNLSIDHGFRQLLTGRQV